jgi:hypothetical protein
MKTKTITLYDYSELSPEAKTKAYTAWWTQEEDPFMQSHMINLLTEKLDERGVKYGKQVTGEDPDVRYSLSSCQGDGFMFIGKFEWKGEIVTVTHNDHHYCHMYTAGIETGDLKSEEVDSFKAMYQEVCKEMERIGYDHIEAITSEDAFIQACDANGYTFREDGTMENE